MAPLLIISEALWAIFMEMGVMNDKLHLPPPRTTHISHNIREKQSSKEMEPLIECGN